jgi:TP901 family phage tail tape measure protein
MGAKFQSAMKGVAMAAGGLTLAAGAAAKLGQEFQEATNLIARGTGATGEQLEELTESFRDVFKNVPQDAATVAGALADINTEMGLEGEALETTTKAFLDFSRAMGEDVGTAITTVADAMEIFNVPVEDTQSLLDKLTVASQASGVSVTGLAANLETFGPILKNAGFTIEESTAIFANLEAAGIGVTRVMPAMNMAIRKLASEGVTDIKSALLGQIEAIKEATTDTEALNIATALFGADGAQRFMVGIRNGALELDTLLGAMENADGTLAELAETTLTMSDKLDIMKNRAKDALVPFGKFATAIGPMVMMIPALATGIAALAGSQWLATAATWAQAAAMTALNIAFGPFLLPLLAAAVAIAALVAVGILLYKNWDTVKEKAGIVWHAVGEGINATVNFIIDKLNWMIDKTNKAISLWLTPLRASLEVVGMFIPKAAEFAKALETIIPEIGEANIEFTKFGEKAVPVAHDAIIEATDVAREMGDVLNDTVTPAIEGTTKAIVEGVNPALAATSEVINDEVLPSLEELTEKLAAEIEKTVKSTEKADLLQHALFILESQVDGVKDAYIEGLLTGDDVIQMYKDMSVELTDDLIPAVDKLETKFQEVSLAAIDFLEIMSGAADKKVRTFFDTDTGELTEYGQELSALRKSITADLALPEITTAALGTSTLGGNLGFSSDDAMLGFDNAASKGFQDFLNTANLGDSTSGRSDFYGEIGQSEGTKKVFQDVAEAVADAVDAAVDEVTTAETSPAIERSRRQAVTAGGWSGGGGGTMGGGGACLTININGPTYGLDDFEDRVTEAIRDGVRRGGFEDILNTSGDGCN